MSSLFSRLPIGSDGPQQADRTQLAVVLRALQVDQSRSEQANRQRHHQALRKSAAVTQPHLVPAAHGEA